MLKEKLSALLEELEGIDNRIKNKDEVIKKVQEENEYLQKQIDEGFKTFNTDTHCLVERDNLTDMIRTIEDISTYDIETEISNARSSCEEAEYSLDSITSSRDDAVKEIEKILEGTEVVEEATEEDETTIKKAPAKKQ